MECERFRDHIAADPAALEPELEAHEQACSACAAYARRLRAAERSISAALRFDVDRLRKDRAGVAPTAARAQPRLWAVAASVLIAGVAIAIGFNLLPSNDPLALADAVEAHWGHEPESWVRTSTPVAAGVLDAALRNEARVELEGLNVVSYARSCLINGRWVPHLVVQGEAGPVMVLLLAREELASEVPLDIPEERLRGVILPVAPGSIAILGRDDEALETIGQQLAEAVDWAI